MLFGKRFDRLACNETIIIFLLTKLDCRRKPEICDLEVAPWGSPPVPPSCPGNRLSGNHQRDNTIKVLMSFKTC